MKKKSAKHLLMAGVTLLSTLFLSMTSFAAGTEGALTAADNSGVRGWAWNVGSYDETLNVELHIYKDDSNDAAKVLTVPANSYSEELSRSIGDGYHAFDCKVNWPELGGTSYKIEAYAISGAETGTGEGGEKILLPGTMEFRPDTVTASSKKDTLAKNSNEEVGPGITPKEEETPEPDVTDTTGKYKRGESLGIFTTTGYCNCEKCSKGNGLTYSGTVPKPNHTLSADISVLPLGTKVMIGDIVYTVEDIGGGVDGYKVDIFYGSHEEALAHGREKQEVFKVIEE